MRQKKAFGNKAIYFSFLARQKSTGRATEIARGNISCQVCAGRALNDIIIYVIKSKIQNHLKNLPVFADGLTPAFWLSHRYGIGTITSHCELERRGTGTTHPMLPPLLAKSFGVGPSSQQVTIKTLFDNMSGCHSSILANTIVCVPKMATDCIYITCGSKFSTLLNIVQNPCFEDSRLLSGPSTRGF